MAPLLLTSSTETLFVHSKLHWDNIQVGYGRGTQVRFTFSKKRLQLGEYSCDGGQTLTIQHEIPTNYEIVEKFEDEDWKGVKLRLVDMQKADEKEFVMS